MNGSLVTETAPAKPTVVPPRPPPPPAKGACCRAHLNTLWSVWYGVSAVGLQAYIAFQSALRFLDYLELGWPASSAPRLELHAYIVLTGTAVLLLPVFLAAAVFKVGNLANDGCKLGRSVSNCSADPPASVALGGGGPRGFWRHSGPTAPFLHIVTAFCLLLPRLLIEARLIQAGFLPKDLIWRTDLDFLVAQRDRLVVLSFMTSPNVNMTFLPTPLPQDTSSHNPLASSKPQTLPLTVGIPDQDLSVNDEPKWGPVSPELLNYALALFVYAIRYPAVFWNTNKWFGALFSIQLLINGAQCILMYAGISVLYKVHVVGPSEALPLLHQRVGLSPSMPQHFLLNRDVTLALFIFSTLLVIKSSLVLYLYGYSRLNSFVSRERARRVISMDSYTGKGWGYFTHCAALCVLLAMAVCQAPLLYDSTVVYRGSLSSAVLACVVGAVVHLFLWVLLWLVLTIKQHWRFKLRVTVGRASVRSARSIKLVTEVDLLSSTDYAQPLLVVGNGRTYTISDNSPKKAIMGVIQKCVMEKKARSQGGSSSSSAKDWMDRDEEQIYWLRPKQTTPKHSPDSANSERLEWFKKPNGAKHKVTFDPSSKKSRSSKLHESEDDGDYARLRELPMLSVGATEQSDGDTASEDNKLLEGVRTASVTYARTNCDLLMPLPADAGDYEDPSPLLTPEPHDLPPPSPPPPPPPVSSNQQTTPRCLRRTDSGMPGDELTPRSDSMSTEASGASPPEAGASPPDHSETSSGVHSNSSRESATANTQRRSTSVDDLAMDAANKVQVQWRSVSLQRGMQPPQPDQSYSSYKAQNMDPTYGIIRNGPQTVEPTYGIMRHNPQQGVDPTYGILRNGPVQNNRVTTHPQEPIYAPYRPQQLYTKSPPVISEEEDVVIRRKVNRPEVPATVTTVGEPFGRATNMRLTSFTDRPQQSATLPHYPTQVVNPAYPHCSTMPLPVSNPTVPPLLGTGTSCNSFPRQHTTIPTHHNGVRLFNPNPYTKRHFPLTLRGCAPPDPGHHTFPQIINLKHNVQHRSDRDSANFSLASSGDSDTHT
ncbi:protein tincar [Macrosteles quadrilineatus]|uniref:protein tincar n=1 Tax=Macrosteles quadrilineatus TaxID=74068 RepID=UPI0023E0972E|nr:protein tincar [Macrosteles quadrilineatus]